ncbi:LysR family transcriptional regulator [Pseudoalteromonas sp. S16_S37]|uniref:LysR family transcriptional regulator n=1 Tax=Pseudoalteromonas sp. S16_S37 TaxID=2720228 RepID=UPI0016813BB5|nr:LysR family transcriptional regulator [Pseudoalteromonas sp. S16_S37]MBD1584293.1 LysR family transcriptional regulator [Pseudoalteromonas sp. S16_S37]
MSKLTELSCFHAVVEQGSFIKAANKLGLSNTAVSACVKRLEKELNVRLLERSTRVVRVTLEGEQFYNQSRSALNQLDNAFERAKESSSTMHGNISIAVPTDLAHTRLLGLIETFLANHPKVTFHISTSDSVTNIYKGGIDVAIRYGKPDDSRLIARALSTKPRVLCASAKYLNTVDPITHPYQLTQLSCICYKVKDNVDCDWTFTGQNGEAITVNVTPKLTTDDSSIAREWALKGHGLIYKSAVDVHEDLKSGKLLPVLTDYTGQASPLHAIYPSAKYQSKRVNEFIKHLLTFDW